MTSSCPHCGATPRPNAKFCGVCGQTLPATPAAPSSAIQPVKSPAPTVYVPPPGPGSSGGALTPGPAALVFPDGHRMPLASPTILGRDETQCQIAFSDDGQASRAHARLEETPHGWLLTDLNSVNGTWVNGQRLNTPISVGPGDQITIGQTTFTFDLPGQAVRPLPVPVRAPTLSPGLVPPPSLVAPTPNATAWRNWNAPPSAEGVVRHVSERYMQKKDDLVKRGFAAAALGLFISPALVFLPFIQGNEIPARDVRIEDHRSNRVVDVKILGEVMGSINLGDRLAVWGEVRGGLILMHAAYNYETDTNIQVKQK